MRRANERRNKDIGPMRFAFVENSGPDNVRDVLRAELKRAREVCIAVAFITGKGINQILQPLRSVATTGKVRVLTGLYQQFTDPSALRTVLKIQKQTKGRFSARLSREPLFHRKLYLIRKRANAIVIVGSSNLTKEGLRSGGELNALLRFPIGAVCFDQALNVFEKDWKCAVDLNEAQVRRYERKRSRKVERTTFTRGQLKEILGTEAQHYIAKGSDNERSTWRTAVAFPASKRSEQIISDITNWDDRGYSWWVCDEKSRCCQDDEVFVFDSVHKSLSLVKVKDSECGRKVLRCLQTGTRVQESSIHIEPLEGAESSRNYERVGMRLDQNIKITSRDC